MCYVVNVGNGWRVVHRCWNAQADCYKDGVNREVYLINDQHPAPLIEVDEGDDIEVFVKNDLLVDTTIHWHGECPLRLPVPVSSAVKDVRSDGQPLMHFMTGLVQRGTPQMDGVPGVSQVSGSCAIASWSSYLGYAWTLLTPLQFPITPGGNFTYRFSTGDEYGFYWYHSHFRAYYNDAIRGPLMIRPSPSRTRPFQQLAINDTDTSVLLQAERDATSVLLNDWTHELSDTVYARYFETGAFPHCVDSILANGYGRVQCLPDQVLQAGTGLGIEATSSPDGMSSMSPGSTGMGIGSMTMPGMGKRMTMDDSTAAAGMSSGMMMMSHATGL